MKDCLKWSAAVVALLMAVAAANAQERPENATATPKAAVSAQSEKNSDANGDGDSIVYQVGGSVQPPIAIHTPDPKFSKEASKAKFSGNVVVALIVDKDGKPRDVHVLRGMGMGLDERAVEAVQQYKFKPAKKNGAPVAVYLRVEVNFRSF